MVENGYMECRHEENSDARRRSTDERNKLVSLYRWEADWPRNDEGCMPDRGRLASSFRGIGGLIEGHGGPHYVGQTWNDGLLQTFGTTTTGTVTFCNNANLEAQSFNAASLMALHKA